MMDVCEISSSYNWNYEEIFVWGWNDEWWERSSQTLYYPWTIPSFNFYPHRFPHPPFFKLAHILKLYNSIYHIIVPY